MAKELYDWIKLALDNKWLVVLCFTGLSSLMTNAAQMVANEDLEVSKVKAIREVAAGFQSVMIELEPTLKQKPVIKPKPIIRLKPKETSCGSCKTIMTDHLREFHE